ncbi:hypothetical protein B0T18DRAFT_491677 [Schizothecium vesticola]|uniref:Uncharacterized protein n=1 Tax=Schizothecium vesticola TaxID=314040 RepID=A0AA40EKX8_9PEZI|nr:hypothetical protein B0T18DRAFT_491677 [Schizothecium vesticola]
MGGPRRGGMRVAVPMICMSRARPPALECQWPANPPGAWTGDNNTDRDPEISSSLRAGHRMDGSSQATSSGGGCGVGLKTWSALIGLIAARFRTTSHYGLAREDKANHERTVIVVLCLQNSRDALVWLSRRPSGPAQDRPCRLGIHREAFAGVRELISKRHPSLAGRLVAAGEELVRLASHGGAAAVCEGVRIQRSLRRLLIPGVIDRNSEFYGGNTEVLTGTPGLQLGEPQAGSSES